MLTDGHGHLKIADFGSTWQQAEQTQTGIAEGTIAFLSPEARANMMGDRDKYDPFKSDMYSLGLSFLCLAALKQPRVEDNKRAMVEALRYSQRWKYLLLRMLRETPDERPTLEDVLKWLQGFSEKPVADSNPAHAELLVDLSTNSSEFTVNLSPFFFLSDLVVCPMFVTGSRGKSSLMKIVAREEVSFEQNEGDPEGVYISPQIDRVGDISVLQMKLSRSKNPNQEIYRQRRKVKAAFMTLTSIWCICEESRDATITEMQTFAEDYAKISAKCNVRLSKVFVFIKEPWFQKEQDRASLDDLFAQNPNLFEIHQRGNEESVEDRTLLAEFINKLGNEALHEPFLRSHCEVFTESFSERYPLLLAGLLKLASKDCTFDYFLQIVPEIGAAEVDFNVDSSRNRRFAENTKAIRNKGRALNFVVQKGRHFTPEFDLMVFSNLLHTHKMNQPTIVLSVMGSPGVGKSTLLNHIVQYCTKSQQVSDIFEMGHATRGSQVLSHPLILDNKQVMLIDLEGLDNTYLDHTRRSAQAILVRAIMTISSVLVIIVQNNIWKLKQAKHDIEMYAKTQRAIGCVAERVYLLIHDSNLQSVLNPEFADAVEDLNRRYFHGRDVVKILNKPNFASASYRDRLDFLEILLSDCSFSKKTIKGTEANIQDILSTLAVFVQEQSQSPLQLTAAQDEQCKRIVEEETARIRSYADDTLSANNISLVGDLESKLIQDFYPYLRNKLTEYPPSIRTYCSAIIELAEKVVKTEFASLESCYGLIRAYAGGNMMLQAIQQFVEYRYASAWCVIEFLSSVKELGDVLQKIKRHFPAGVRELNRLIQCYEQEVRQMTEKSGQNMVIRLAAIVAMIAARATGFEAGAKVAAVGVCWGYGQNISSARLISGKANEIISVGSPFSRGEINTTVAKQIKEQGAQPALVLLCIGSTTTKLAAFANYVVRYISPFAADYSAFDETKYAQILSFSYVSSASSETQISFVHLICLRMEEEPTSKYAQTTLSIAETLLPAASLACILSNERSSYVQPLIRCLATPRSERPKVLWWHSHDQSFESLGQQMRQLTIPHELTYIPHFLDTAVLASVAQVKAQLDIAPVRNAGLLLQQIAALPAAASSSHLP